MGLEDDPASFWDSFQGQQASPIHISKGTTTNFNGETENAEITTFHTKYTSIPPLTKSSIPPLPGAAKGSTSSETDPFSGALNRLL